MPALLTKFPRIKANFNLTPSLLTQLKDYVDEGATDDFWEISSKPASALTLEDKKFILSNFFMANWETMVARFPRYLELLEKRGRYYTPALSEKVVSQFAERDFADLQVLFNLCWFGFMKSREDREISELIKKGADFTPPDKERVLARQKETMAELIPLYKKLEAHGQIEISTTPFYHPILPLLYNGGEGQGFNFKEDAHTQVEKAIGLYEEIFGHRPEGMWPAEGGVSESIIPILASHGIKWIATDEEILTESLKGRKRDELVYKPYLLKRGEMELKIIFRDKNLSNILSFVYSRNNPQQAARDLLGHLRCIKEALSLRKEDGAVSIILDGENPWEYYQNSGEDFLNHLYTYLSREEGLESVTISDYLKGVDTLEEIPYLASGSWIDHNFRIWIGKPEKDLAWEYLKNTRSFLDSHSPREAWEELYVAEGSDWFWWYGDDFSSANDEAFDLLFRTHLMNVHRHLGREIPSFLSQPILSKGRVTLKQEPQGVVSPILDGRVTDYYEWLEAGIYRIDESGGTMHLGTSFLKEIRFGFDLKFIYFRFDLTLSPLDPGLSRTSISLEFSEPVGVSIEIPLGKKSLSNSYALGEIVEVRIPWKEMAIERPKRVRFFTRVKKEGIIYETWPRSGFISFRCPSEDYELMSWSA